ncbi:metallophosphoesterase [Terrabacter sp. 2TAF16]|uniref:metallophosphoesterase n=1 Tax=Terrabacter sp. 2TAF16 TaxID=3233008 RepID=UPI003F9BE6B5
MGDIHGEVEPLQELLGLVRKEVDGLVFLGDYVNRGPHSSAVIQTLIDFSHRFRGDVHFLRGHHDAAFLDAIEGGRLDIFLRMGGAATLNSYRREEAQVPRLRLHDRIPQEHIEFLRSLEDRFVGNGCLAMHARQSGLSQPPGHFGVFGHKPQLSGKPLIADDSAMIDTGCGTIPGGPLTCFLWPSREWLQSS